MVRTGDYAIPRINDFAYLEKPPLYYAAAAFVCRAAGSLAPGCIRLPAALFGFGALLLIRWVAGLRLGRRAADTARGDCCRPVQASDCSATRAPWRPHREEASTE